MSPEGQRVFDAHRRLVDLADRLEQEAQRIENLVLWGHGNLSTIASCISEAEARLQSAITIFQALDA
ncbi:MAG TPA: hypothetical protein VNU71_14700 [Burkholderiaceae bacterium]|nr:hypothetical protein [Burkholderiaceae bacterium]